MQDMKAANHAVPNFVIVTGLSGSGMSSATNAFEDLGYFCVDNLPITLLSAFSRLLTPNDENVTAIDKAALVIDIREGHFLSDFSKELKKFAKKNSKNSFKQKHSDAFPLALTQLSISKITTQCGIKSMKCYALKKGEKPK